MLGSDGAKFIAKSNHMQNLERLDLEQNYITFSGLRCILMSSNMRNLKYLELSNNTMEIACVEFLLDNGQNFTYLEYLGLYGILLISPDNRHKLPRFVVI